MAKRPMFEEQQETKPSRFRNLLQDLENSAQPIIEGVSNTYDKYITQPSYSAEQGIQDLSSNVYKNALGLDEEAANTLAARDLELAQGGSSMIGSVGDSASKFAKTRGLLNRLPPLEKLNKLYKHLELGNPAHEAEELLRKIANSKKLRDEFTRMDAMRARDIATTEQYKALNRDPYALNELSKEARDYRSMVKDAEWNKERIEAARKWQEDWKKKTSLK